MSGYDDFTAFCRGLGHPELAILGRTCWLCDQCFELMNADSSLNGAYAIVWWFCRCGRWGVFAPRWPYVVLGKSKRLQ